ncbi:MAG: oligosaccharide flippase family protein [bacterium]|nr:oligosaccharide flippase family protein [bacterium]
MDLRQKYAYVADLLTKALKLDVRFYGRVASWLTTSHLTSIMRGVATTFLMARWLAPEPLGQFRYTLALFGIAGIFSLTGMNASIIKGVAKGETGIARLAVRKIIFVSPMGSILLFITALERYLHGERVVATMLTIAAIAFVPYTLSGLYGPILTGLEKIPKLATFAIVNNLIYATAFVIVLFGTRNIVTITFAYFFFDILIRGWFTLREFKRLPKSQTGTAYLALGYHMSGIGLLYTVGLYLNQILLQRFWGYSTLAIFSVATVIPEQIQYAFKNLTGIFLQRMSRHEKSEGILRTTRQHFWLVFLGTFVVILAYAATAPFLIPLLFPQYSDATLPSIVYAIGLLGLPCIIGTYFFQAHGEIRRLWRFTIVQFIIQLTSSLTLVPLFGGWGAIWARVLTRVGSLPFGLPALTRQKNEEERPSSTKNV